MGEITRGSRVKVREVAAGEEIPWPEGCAPHRLLYRNLSDGPETMCHGTVVALEDIDGAAVALVVFDGNVDSVDDEDGDGIPSVWAWRIPVYALAVASDPVDDAIAAERARIGAWLRAQKEANVADRLWLSRGVEHGDHIDDDAPPLPSLRAVMQSRDVLIGQIREREAEANDLRAEVARLQAEGRRIDPVEHAREILNGWLWWHSWWAQRDDRAASMSAWATSEERAELLALVGADVLAEVER